MATRSIFTAAALLLLGSAAAGAQVAPPPVIIPPFAFTMPGEPALAGVSRLALPSLPTTLVPAAPGVPLQGGAVDLTPNSLMPVVDPSATLIRLPRPCARLAAIDGRLHCIATDERDAAGRE